MCVRVHVCEKKALKMMGEIPKEVIIFLDTLFDLGSGQNLVMSSRVPMSSVCPECP